MTPLWSALLANAVLAAGLGAVAFLVWRAARLAPLAHALLLLALLKLVTPPMLGVPVPGWPAWDAAPAASAAAADARPRAGRQDGPPSRRPTGSREPVSGDAQHAAGQAGVPANALPAAVGAAAISVLAPMPGGLAGGEATLDLVAGEAALGPAAGEATLDLVAGEAALGPAAGQAALASAPRALASPPPPARPGLGAALASAIATALPWLTAIWLLGAAATAVVAWRRARRCARLVHRAEAASPAVAAEAARLAGPLGLRRAPPVRVVDARVSPFLWALGCRPVVVLPRWLLQESAPQDLRPVLAHELAHLANRDHWARWLELAVAVAHWWNPLAHRVRRLLHEIEEVRCDARAVEALGARPRQYGRAILRVATQLESGPVAVPLGASGLGGPEALKRRLTMIANCKLSHRLPWTARLAVAAGALGLLPLGVVAQEPESGRKAELTPRSRGEAKAGEAEQGAEAKKGALTKKSAKTEKGAAEVDGRALRLRIRDAVRNALKEHGIDIDLGPIDVQAEIDVAPIDVEAEVDVQPFDVQVEVEDGEAGHGAGGAKKLRYHVLHQGDIALPFFRYHDGDGDDDDGDGDGDRQGAQDGKGSGAAGANKVRYRVVYPDGDHRGFVVRGLDDDDDDDDGEEDEEENDDEADGGKGRGGVVVWQHPGGKAGAMRGLFRAEDGDGGSKAARVFRLRSGDGAPARVFSIRTDGGEVRSESDDADDEQDEQENDDEADGGKGRGGVFVWGHPGGKPGAMRGLFRAEDGDGGSKAARVFRLRSGDGAPARVFSIRTDDGEVRSESDDAGDADDADDFQGARVHTIRVPGDGKQLPHRLNGKRVRRGGEAGAGPVLWHGEGWLRAFEDGDDDSDEAASKASPRDDTGEASRRGRRDAADDGDLEAEHRRLLRRIRQLERQLEAIKRRVPAKAL